MKKTILILLTVAITLNVTAQKAKEDFKRDRNFSGGNYYAYPTPNVKQTPAPKGYNPFYISHYGRHGSRYLIGTGNYNRAYDFLAKADSMGVLTPLGKETFEKVRLICNEAKKRDGELTKRGAEQHKGIAKRMYENFPQVFAGEANVDAKSTVVIRCILSMENALQQLLLCNPKLNITHDASEHDMYYMNYTDTLLRNQRMPKEVKKIYDDFRDKHTNNSLLMSKLFSDKDFWQKNKKGSDNFAYSLFLLTKNVQSTELRHKLSLYELFTDEEIYSHWLAGNAWWYLNYAAAPQNGGLQPYTQRNLLRNIITQADSCIQLEHPGATLRYGHDTMVMPLICLLEANDWGKQYNDLEDLANNNWNDYEIVPMAANLQFVFYRKNAQDKNIIFKLLFNEKEVRLPLPTNQYPYYKWSDFKKYYLEKLQKAQPLLQSKQQ